MSLYLKRASTIKDLKQIKSLQSANLKQNLSADEMGKEGFLTASYSLEQLQLMNSLMPSIIAVDQEEVVGYALAVNKDLKGQHELLDDMIRQVDRHTFNGVNLKECSYAIVGQLCVAKSHRGMGLVHQLYHCYKEHYASKFPYLITDVDKKNVRSLKAHIKCGFEIIGELTFNQSEFVIVAWDWNIDRSS